MVFVEFTERDSSGGDTKHYFVGSDLQAVMDDTENGTMFGRTLFSAYVLVSERAVRDLNLRYLQAGIASVLRRESASFKLGPPIKGGARVPASQGGSCVSPRMSERQMAALERTIMRSNDASEFGKKAIIWLLRQSEHLTKPVAACFTEIVFGEDKCKEIQSAAHDMGSSRGTTHIEDFFLALGTPMYLGHHIGVFTQGSDEILDGGCTIWFSVVYYDREALFLRPPSIERIMKIEAPPYPC